ncbi:Dyp-type peroxidase [Macroventuria anomochaeta]|uniref:Dyp-type peroxidase n=1 Tax=Macroventuria anomochaeta TaxID=301207 RepID=A0ACB6SD25_9PLEO|nr:Dyp-type peroxidase [Macroventuria anomochaeta]KAF2631510.1 Dyp-type peroxidase [Macroventuria anomochaeta]
MNPLKIEDLSGIQGDILLNGFPKKAEVFSFFTIRATQQFCQTIQTVASSKIATGKDIKDLREQISKLPKGQIIDVAKTNIAFTSGGLTKLSNSQRSLQRGLNGLQNSAPSFVVGMQNETEREALGDPVFSNWNLNQNGGGSIDGVLIVAGIKMETVQAELKNVYSQLNKGGEAVIELFKEIGVERASQPGHEHFGFNDGISHPQVFGINNSPSLTFQLDDVVQPKDTSNFVDPGVIVVGRHGDENNPKPQWMTDGSFLVFRKLEQHVGKWNDFVVNKWKDAGSSGPAQFGAQLMGRWQSGCPIHIQDQRDDSTLALRNDFDYGGLTKQGKCPLAAHIRKAHIRTGFNSTRIMRRGIPYGDDFRNGQPDVGRGLLFACYQSTIENGYRFIQTAWANQPGFPTGDAGLDVTIGQGKATDPPSPFQIGTKSVNINPINDFVTAKGGEYFFAPSMKVLRAGFNIENLEAKL